MKNGSTMLIVLLLLILTSFTTPSLAGTYYVSPTGTASWSAATNINTPCSWQTAMANAIADDLVYFRGGTYTPGNPSNEEYPTMNPANSGTSGHPITFKAYPGETPVITSATNVGCPFGVGHRDYIVWDGFTGTLTNFISNIPAFFSMWYTTGSKLINSNFTGFTNNAPTNASLITLHNTTDCEISNNILHGMNGTGVNTGAIWNFQASTRLIFRNNTIYDCANGYMQKFGSHVSHKIHNNFIYSISRDGIMLNDQVGGSAVEVYQNVIVNAGANAINVYEGGGGSQTNYLIYNNTIWGSSVGILTGDYARNNQIFNNIIYGAGNPFLVYFPGTALPSYSDYNNFYRISSNVWRIVGTNYNSLTSWRSGTGYDINSITIDPGFISVGSTSVTDYKRTTYSINGRGGNYASVMGAYITGNELIGAISSGLGSPPPPPLRTPSPPSLLQIR